ncbi:MAG: hypothetical protein JRI49_02705 [Deltaproteobacteria bacterium]|nr:hypothetical protein [Deltaproteobacteria bacterium]
MIDIHAHILPEVDDGASTWNESLKMIEMGLKDGIKGAVCTSHVLDRLDDEIEQLFIQKFERLKKLVQDRGLSFPLWLGSEIHFYARYDTNSRVASFNGNGKYMLLELPMAEISQDFEEKIFELSLNGITAILAHPERNAVIIRKPQEAFEMIQRGVLLQLNAGSITGQFGRKIKRVALEMLDHNMVHFIASDCHNAGNRPMVLSGAYRLISSRYDKRTAEKLFHINPYKVIHGQEISPPMPVPFDDRRGRKGIFSLFGIRSKR